METEVGDNYPWMKDGLCVGMPYDLFYENYERSPKLRPYVDQICQHCPVRRECRVAGSEGEWGQWGEIFWDGSGKPDRERNKHKTDQDWIRIEHDI